MVHDAHNAIMQSTLTKDMLKLHYVQFQFTKIRRTKKKPLTLPW